jgi:hypothetical protein
MKQHAKWFAAALAVAGSLAIANSVRAQAVTGTPYLSNMNPSTLNTGPNALYGNWPSAIFTSLPTGLEVKAANVGGGGSLYYVVPSASVQTLNPLDTEAVFTFTVNDNPAAYIWVGTRFVLNDNAGAAWYDNPGYSGYGNGGNPSDVVWNGNVVKWTVPLSAAQLTAVQAGNDAIYAFNLVVDPAVLAAGSSDITFNSLVLQPVPEPASLGLVGLGVAGLLAFRRRQ